MDKTKAAFKATREACGMTQNDVARIHDVDVRSVKRWENPAVEGYEPPEDVWLWLRQAYAAMVQDARELTESIIESMTPASKGIMLDYYRSQEHLQACQPGSPEPVGYYNARARLIGDMLAEREITYTYRYPTADGPS